MDSISQLPLFNDIEPQPKRCPKCGEYFPRMDEFWHKSKQTKDGYRGWCKLCQNIDNAQYRSNNPEKCREAWKRYVENNPDKIKEKAKREYHNDIEKNRRRGNQWAKNNPEKVKERQKRYNKTAKAKERYRRYYQNHPQKMLEKERNRYRNYPQKIRIKNQKRRARRLGNGGDHTHQELEALYEAQDHRCFHCGKWISLKNGQTRHIDHWIPYSKGGTNNIDNIKLLCPFCNLSKGAKLPCEWDQRYCE